MVFRVACAYAWVEIFGSVIWTGNTNKLGAWSFTSMNISNCHIFVSPKRARRPLLSLSLGGSFCILSEVS